MIIRLAARPGNLPFPVSGSLVEHHRVREGQELLDTLEKFSYQDHEQVETIRNKNGRGS